MNKNYWLFTKNYLIRFKDYFETREEALRKLKKIIKVSEEKHKHQLYLAMHREEEMNLEKELMKSEEIKSLDLQIDEKIRKEKIKNILNNYQYKISTKAKREYETFKYFNEKDLESSITLLDVKDMDKTSKEEIFLCSK